MPVTPALRRALHQAVDLVLDALAQERDAPPKKRTRRPATPVVTMPADATPAEIEAAKRTWERNGYREMKPTRPLTPEEQAQLERQLAKAGYKRP